MKGFAVRDPGDIIRGITECPELTVWELCPECENEVEIPAYGRSVCPVCGAPILPCSMCARCVEPCVYETLSCNHPITYQELLEICYEGRCMSDKEWAKETGIPRATIRYRIFNGWPLDMVFSKEKFSHGKTHRGAKINKRHSAHGPSDWFLESSTRTVAEWSRVTGIPKYVLYQRLNDGMTMGQAIRKPYTPEGKTYTYGGRTMTLKEWAKETGIPYHRLYQRLRKGYTFEEALTLPYNSPPKRGNDVQDTVTTANRKRRLFGWLGRFR